MILEGGRGGVLGGSHVVVDGWLRVEGRVVVVVGIGRGAGGGSGGGSGRRVRGSRFGHCVVVRGPFFERVLGLLLVRGRRLDVSGAEKAIPKSRGAIRLAQWEGKVGGK